MKKFYLFFMLATISFLWTGGQKALAAIDCPVKTTTITDSKFADNTQWYIITIDGNMHYWYDAGEGTKLTLDNNNIYTQGTTTITESMLWCIVGDQTNGYKFYNKGAGTTRCLTSSTTMSGTTGAETYPSLKTEATTGETSLWDFESASTYTIQTTYSGYFISQHDLASNVLNFRTPYLAYWTGGKDAGSTVVFIPYNELDVKYATEIAEAENLVTHQNCVGFYDEAQTAGLKTALDTYKSEKNEDNIQAVKDATTALKDQTILAFSPDKYYYRLLCRSESEGYAYSSSDGIRRTKTADQTTTVWQFISNGSGRYYMRNADNGKYLKAVTATNIQYTLEDTKSSTYSVELKNGVSYFNIKQETAINSQYAALHAADAGTNNARVVVWGDAANNSMWLLEQVSEIPSFDITVSDINMPYRTSFRDYAYTLPDGITAYTGTINGLALTLNELTEKVIPANTPIILKAEAEDTYTFKKDLSTASAIGNALIGTLEQKSVTENNIYGLGFKDDQPGFYKMSTTGTTIRANSAYLQINIGAAQMFSFDFGTVTSIEGAEVNNKNVGTYFDLQGRSVKNPKKGLYILNGKKVVVE